MGGSSPRSRFGRLSAFGGGCYYLAGSAGIPPHTPASLGWRPSTVGSLIGRLRGGSITPITQHSSLALRRGSSPPRSLPSCLNASACHPRHTALQLAPRKAASTLAFFLSLQQVICSSNRQLVQQRHLSENARSKHRDPVSQSECRPRQVKFFATNP